MDEMILHLEEITNRFMNELNTADYVTVENFVEQREKIILNLRSLLKLEPLLDKHKASIHQLAQFDAVIVEKIKELSNDAVLKIRSFQTASARRNAYDFEQATESIFFDKRK
jgi:DNA-directed RNA polymerase sigma subunit (sigma70/sigma32)